MEQWLEMRIPLDPLLKGPLDLHGVAAKRRHQVVALAGQLGLGHRFEESANRPVTESTYRLLFPMLDSLGAARHQMRIHVPEYSTFVVVGSTGTRDGTGIANGDVLQALHDLGWSHMTVEFESRISDVREITSGIRHLYISTMAERVVRMFRRWEKRGWISDKAV